MKDNRFMIYGIGILCGVVFFAALIAFIVYGVSEKYTDDYTGKCQCFAGWTGDDCSTQVNCESITDETTCMANPACIFHDSKCYTMTDCPSCGGQTFDQCELCEQCVWSAGYCGDKSYQCENSMCPSFYEADCRKCNRLDNPHCEWLGSAEGCSPLR